MSVPQRSRICRLIVVSCMVLLGPASGAPAADGAGIHGRVLGLAEDGKLLGIVAGAKIEVKDQAGSVAAQVTSGQDGTYQLDLAPGTYYYKVTADGYKDEDTGRGFKVQNSDGRAIYNFSLTEGQTDPNHTPPNIEPVPLGRLTGHVFERKADGELIGISGAQITLRLEKTRALAQAVTPREHATAESKGAYELVLQTGTWQAAVSAEGFEVLLSKDPIRIEPAAVTRADFVLTRRQPPPSKGQGINTEVHVVATQRDLAVPSGIALEFINLASGLNVGQVEVREPPYRLTQDLPPGAYRVVARAEGYQAARSGPTYVFPGRYSQVALTIVGEWPQPPPAKVVPPDEPRPAEELLLAVTVYEGVADNARPLSDADILARMEGQSLENAPRGKTRADGTVELPITEPGEYAAVAQKPGYQPSGKRVRINAGATGRVRVEFYLAKADETTPADRPPPVEPEPSREQVEVTGFVVYRDARSTTGYFGIEGAKLTWEPVGPGGRLDLYEAESVRLGAYKLELPEGDYRVQVVPRGRFDNRTETVSVKFGMKPKYFILALKSATEPPPDKPVVDVGGYVMTPADVPGGFAGVAGAVVRWIPMGSRSVAGSDTSNAGGQFSLQLAAGQYRVQVSPPLGYAAAEEVVVDVRQGMPRPRLVLARTVERVPPPPPPDKHRLFVQVVDAQTNQPLSADVRITFGPGQFQTGKADRAGRYLLELGPGKYYAEVTQADYTAFGREFQIAGSDVTVVASLERAPQNGGGRRPPPQKGRLNLVVVDARTNQPLEADVRIVLGAGQFRTGRTDRTGRYSYEFGAGTYYAQVVLRGYKSFNEQFTITSGDVTVRAVLQPEPKIEQQTPPPNQQHQLVLRVTSKHTNRPMAANVRVTLGRSSINGKTDDNGNYSIRLDPGSYYVQVGAANYKVYTENFTIRDADVNLNVPLELERKIE